MYRFFLGRDPDVDGLRIYQEAIADGVPIEDMLQAFVSSQEFKARFYEFTMKLHG